ncbi:MAG: hypothetical protein H3C34_08580 [Caldilineaceae bacterium]|nr:hypothetical protein [Caldilineaceae bacterium]
MIRTGILCVPTYDEAAVDAVRQLLASAVPQAVVLQDRHAGAQRYVIEELLRHWCDEEELDLIITVGGTLPAPGPSERECVAEATLAVADRLAPGLAEAMRAYAVEETPLALLDRGVSAIRGRSLLLNLPAGAGPATLFLEAVVEVLDAYVAHLQELPSAPQLADEVTFTNTTADETDTDNETAGTASAGHGLDADEFREFLKRRSGPATG